MTLFSNEMGILGVDFDGINLNDFNFDKNDPETTIHVRRMAWCNSFKQRKGFKTELSMVILKLWFMLELRLGVMSIKNVKI